MTVSGKKAALLAGFIFILLAPPLASGKSPESGADGGIFLSQYQEQYQHAFYILIPKGWKAEVYKVITDQIETFDPESGKSKYLPMYNHAYTDGHGNYFLRDYDDGTLPFENATEWRKLKIINRNEVN
jgi:hypothetical protein